MEREEAMLFGSLAVKSGRVTPSQLVWAVEACGKYPEEDLPGMLAECNALSERDCEILKGLVAAAVKTHGSAQAALKALEERKKPSWKLYSSPSYSVPELSALGEKDVRLVTWKSSARALRKPVYMISLCFFPLIIMSPVLLVTYLISLGPGFRLITCGLVAILLFTPILMSIGMDMLSHWCGLIAAPCVRKALDEYILAHQSKRQEAHVGA